MVRANRPLRPPKLDDPPPDGPLPQESPRPARRREAVVTYQPEASERDPARTPPRRVPAVFPDGRDLQRLDAVKLYGPHAIWKDVGNRLLDDGLRFGRRP